MVFAWREAQSETGLISRLLESFHDLGIVVVENPCGLMNTSCKIVGDVW
jgi:hypothetical protein